MPCLDLTSLPDNLCGFFSDRTADFKEYARHGEMTDGQRRYLVDHLGHDPRRVATIRQVHGANIVMIDSAAVPDYPDADGLLTNQVGTVLTVRTADCLPVFIWSEDTDWIGLLHAGWKSTQQQIAAKALALLKEAGCPPASLRILFGPAIRRCCFEVGQEFQDYFPAQVAARNDKLYFDIAAANAAQLGLQGVGPDQIIDTGLCTCCDEDFFSYRRDGDDAGRHLSALMRV